MEKTENQKKNITRDQIINENKDFVTVSKVMKLLESDLAFITQYILQDKKPVTPALEKGVSIHNILEAMFDPEKKLVAMPDFGDLRTKENKETKLSFLEENKKSGYVICTHEEYKLKTMVEIAFRAEKKILEQINIHYKKYGKSIFESGFILKDQMLSTGKTCSMKGLRDIYLEDNNLVLDYKTSFKDKSKPQDFIRWQEVHLAIQDYIYRLSAGKDSAMVFLSCQSTWPFNIKFIELSSGLKELGESLFVNTFKPKFDFLINECTKILGFNPITDLTGKEIDKEELLIKLSEKGVLSLGVVDEALLNSRTEEFILNSLTN